VGLHQFHVGGEDHAEALEVEAAGGQLERERAGLVGGLQAVIEFIFQSAEGLAAGGRFRRYAGCGSRGGGGSRGRGSGADRGQRSGGGFDGLSKRRGERQGGNKCVLHRGS